MFQTEIMIGLQSLSSEGLTWLMRQITATGYYSSVAAIVITVMLGINLRKGFLLFQIFAWTGMASEFCKVLFGLPRPFFADARVLCLEPGWNATTSFSAQGAANFFSLPPRQVIEAFRLQGLSFGFPSGHVSGSIAMWGGLAVLFRGRRLAWLAPLFVSLVAFTRMYLGVHFLGDVLGGALLGGLMLFFAYRLVGKADGQKRFFTAAKISAGAVLPLILYATIMFVLPLLLVVLAVIPAAFAGFFVGLNAAFTLILRQGPPEDGGSLPVRVARVLLGGFIFLLLNWAMRQGLACLQAPQGPWPAFISTGLGCFLTFLFSVQLFLRLGLYKKGTQVQTASA
jgi:membrane-associated phospholipid phosphatase